MTATRFPTLLVLALAITTPLRAEEPEADRFRHTISVVGEGKATAPPDMATIRTGVIAQAESAKEALAKNSAAMQKIMAELRQRGVEERDVQTSAFHVMPVYERDEHFRQPQQGTRIIAYRVHNEVQVRVRDLNALGEILDALVAAGSNQISGVTFDIADPSTVLRDARRRAVRDAKSRAEVYAEAANVEMGRVLQIREQPVEWPRPMHMGIEFRAADAAVPIAPGEQELRTTVHIVYELRQREND